MKKRWREMVLAQRVSLIGCFAVVIPLLAVTLAAQAGAINARAVIWIDLLATPVVAIGYIVVAVVGRRQELDAAVRRGREWDEHECEGHERATR